MTGRARTGSAVCSAPCAPDQLLPAPVRQRNSASAYCCTFNVREAGEVFNTTGAPGHSYPRGCPPDFVGHLIWGGPRAWRPPVRVEDLGVGEGALRSVFLRDADGGQGDFVGFLRYVAVEFSLDLAECVLVGIGAVSLSTAKPNPHEPKPAEQNEPQQIPLRRPGCTPTVLQADSRRLKNEIPDVTVRRTGSLSWPHPPAGDSRLRPGRFRVGRRDVAALEPNLRHPPGQVIHTPSDAGVDPTALAHALVAAAGDHGATVLHETAVTSLQVTNGRVEGVLTSAGLHAATTVVLTSFWSYRRLKAQRQRVIRPLKTRSSTSWRPSGEATSAACWVTAPGDAPCPHTAPSLVTRQTIDPSTSPSCTPPSPWRPPSAVSSPRNSRPAGRPPSYSVAALAPIRGTDARGASLPDGSGGCGRTRGSAVCGRDRCVPGTPGPTGTVASNRGPAPHVRETRRPQGRPPAGIRPPR
ncbi:FAD-dependent oxidoreductase [Streptomyces sp. NPDC127108]|uniref:FAD-dependent oxidoreductase n=1 Tax=Streptomyces sp. NPDC127108 TaxID=3345361 RepID=UPI003636FEEA